MQRGPSSAPAWPSPAHSRTSHLPPCPCPALLPPSGDTGGSPSRWVSVFPELVASRTPRAYNLRTATVQVPRFWRLRSKDATCATLVCWAGHGLPVHTERSGPALYWPLARGSRLHRCPPSQPWGPHTAGLQCIYSCHQELNPWLLRLEGVPQDPLPLLSSRRGPERKQCPLCPRGVCIRAGGALRGFFHSRLLTGREGD